MGAMDNPHVDCIGHLTGRRLLKRDGAPVDVERVVAHAVETGTALEINSQPDRLDMRDTHARLAGEAGVRIPITTDAHSVGALGYAELGVAQARRAWLTREQILNTRSWRDIERLASDRLQGGRSARARVGRVVPRACRASSRCCRRSSRGRFGRRYPRRRPRIPSRSRQSSGTSTRSFCRGSRTGRARASSPTSRRPGRSRACSPSSSIAGLNQVGILWRTSPALQELEEVTVDWLRQLVGLPAEFRGHIEDTASTGVLAAAIVARSLTPDRRVLVCSEHAHSVGEKAARLLGLELRKVPTDDVFRMRPELIGEHDACLVLATVGTTGMASVDPVPEIAERCAAAGTWLHVDAAYAGSAAILPELQGLFAGWERADSIGVNPHKWLGVPMDCSVLWTRRQEEFRNAFSLVPEFLRSPDDALNLSEVSIPLGRRFRALKLWAVLRCYGRRGLQERLREHLRLAELFEGWVRAEPGWEVTAPRHFSLVCFRREGSDEDNERLLERVNDTGEVFLSHTRFADRYQLRLAIGNFRTTEEDVRLAWDVLRREAAAL